MAESITMEGKLLFPSEYIAAADLKGKDVTLTVSRVELSELRMEGGGKKVKPLIFFQGANKKLVLNKTNAKTIAALHGGAVEGWVGKRITLYPTKARFGSSTVDAVRVRDQAPQQPAPPSSEPVTDSDIQPR